MASILVPLLLLGTASAQLTTSIWAYDSLASISQIGYVGSVINVSNRMTTIAAVYDNGTDLGRSNLFGEGQTFTVGPNTFEMVQTLNESVNPRATQSDANIFKYGCTKTGTATDEKSSCTLSWGPGAARYVECGVEDQPSPYLRTRIQTFTYSGRLNYSAGVTTVTSIQSFSARTTPKAPDWCKESSGLPASGGSEKVTLAIGVIGTFQMVLTAGVEKLSATPAASGSGTGPSSTGTSGGSASGSAGAGVPMRTAGPILAGLGAAAAVFL